MKIKHVLPDLTNKNPAEYTSVNQYVFGNECFETGLVKNSIHPVNKVYFKIRNEKKKELILSLELREDEAMAIVAGLSQAFWASKNSKVYNKTKWLSTKKNSSSMKASSSKKSSGD